MFAYRKKKRSTIFAISAKPCRKKIVINWRACFLGALIISALIGFLYLLIFSSVLKIKKWSVESSNFTSTAQAQETVNRFFNEKIWKIFPQNNWLVFFGRDLSDQLLLAYPE